MGLDVPGKAGRKKGEKRLSQVWHLWKERGKEGRVGDDSQTATQFQEMFSQGTLASYVLLEGGCLQTPPCSVIAWKSHCGSVVDPSGQQLWPSVNYVLAAGHLCGTFSFGNIWDQNNFGCFEHQI